MKIIKLSLTAGALGMFLLLAATGRLCSAEGDRPAAPPPPPPHAPPPPKAVEGERKDPAPELRPNRRDAAEGEERLRLMEAEIKELRRVGDNEAAARLERQRNQLKERLQGEREPREVLTPMVPGEGGPRPGLEMERRQRLIRSAIENLQAAGLPELADQVAREARNQMGNPMNDRGGMRPMGGQGQGEGAMRGGGTEPERMERMEMGVREMQQALREMERRLRALER